ncbi:phosphatidylinositol-specific phospholipase C1-like protein [Streptomyces sp. NPDC005438]|uniref:phosphatidylinositol-specific phospholipase C1-like protein n=1 Tax=Streptomyces sp. NPDC005438 TaxID=3156880 RepID=UPI0033B01E9E
MRTRSTTARKWLCTVTALAAALTVSSAARPASAGERSGQLRLNQTQFMATHNSYHREVSHPEQGVQRQFDPGAATGNLEYSHASLPEQLARQKARGIELDVFPDPQGGLYADPLIRKRAGLPPMGGAEWKKPGFKVMHWADFDYRTSCVAFRDCLRQVKRWSERQGGGHTTVPILLELKRTDPRLEEQGGAKSPPWDTAMLDALDREIRAVFGERGLVTPDDVRRRGKTLERSVLDHGWPRLREARGRVMFLMDNDDQEIQDAYRAGGRESLQGRVLFTDSRPGRPDAAFVKWNDPTGANVGVIRDLVRRGYFVRTRSDVPVDQASSGDRGMLRDALRSGAQMVSTDYPSPGLAARHGSDYLAELPGGMTVRCNPVTARHCPVRVVER